MPENNDYKPYLVKMMNYLDDPDPPTNKTVFSVEQLSAVTADDFIRHVNIKVYGVAGRSYLCTSASDIHS